MILFFWFSESFPRSFYLQLPSDDGFWLSVSYSMNSLHVVRRVMWWSHIASSAWRSCEIASPILWEISPKGRRSWVFWGGVTYRILKVFFFCGGGGVGDMNLSGIDKKKDIESMGMWKGLHTTTARDSWKSHRATVPPHLKISRAARCDLHILQTAFWGSSLCHH